MTAPKQYRGDHARAELVALVGELAARQLGEAFGGTILYIPARPGDHHAITATIGREAADRLGAALPGERLLVPKPVLPRDRVLELRKYGGLTVKEIALQTGFTERHVYRLLSDDHDDAQMSIFDIIGSPTTSA